MILGRDFAYKSKYLVLLITFFLFIACDTEKPVKSFNERPIITSSPELPLFENRQFVFRPEFQDTDGPDTIVTFHNFPNWLKPDADSIFGVVPDDPFQISFTVIVSDGIDADTLVIVAALPKSIIIYGDTRTGHSVHGQIIELIRNNRPDAVFHVGDLVNNGNSQSDWDIFNEITGELRSETDFYPALGNHEYQSDLYFDNFELPNNEQWYSVELHGIHFIVLNTCVDIGPGSEQYLWLVSDLSNIGDNIKYTAAIFHHPAYNTGQHIEDEKDLREKIMPLFNQYGVDIVFAGHDHNYERSYCGGIYHIVTGGGGAPLRDQSRTHPCSQLFLKRYHYCQILTMHGRMTVMVFDNYNALIDKFEIFPEIIS